VQIERKGSAERGLRLGRSSAQFEDQAESILYRAQLANGEMTHAIT
jgi:hypothetical protein